MITLKELVDRQKFTGEDDTQLIATWYLENDMALEGIRVISKLAQDKIEDDKYLYEGTFQRFEMYGATENLIEEFGLKDGCRMDNAIKNFIACNGKRDDFFEHYPSAKKWLAEFVPTQKLPLVFWLEFREYLHKQGIYFKDEKKGEEV